MPKSSKFNSNEEVIDWIYIIGYIYNAKIIWPQVQFEVL